VVNTYLLRKTETPMHCPKCGQNLDPVQHGDLVFDGQVWCDRCQRYDDRLLEIRPFQELETWAQRICLAFGQDPVQLQRDPDYLPNPNKYYNGATFLLAEADHYHRTVMLHPPGHRIKTLCHELAHLFTSQDHTEQWARTFAALSAWVKERLKSPAPPDDGVA
jgi:hypothetical protein